MAARGLAQLRWESERAEGWGQCDRRGPSKGGEGYVLGQVSTPVRICQNLSVHDGNCGRQEHCYPKNHVAPEELIEFRLRRYITIFIIPVDIMQKPRPGESTECGNQAEYQHETAIGIPDMNVYWDIGAQRTGIIQRRNS